MGSDSLKLPGSCDDCKGELIQRMDDREIVIHKRFNRFRRQTAPVINFFKKKFGSLVIEEDASLPGRQIMQRIWRRLRPLLILPKNARTIQEGGDMPAFLQSVD